jgi:hypothetical protein
MSRTGRTDCLSAVRLLSRFPPYPSPDPPAESIIRHRAEDCVRLEES